MAKKSNRESTTLGHHVTTKPTRIKAPPAKGNELLADLIERETAAMNAAADAKEAELFEHGYTGRGADPGTLVGLDGFTPGGDTAPDGDTKRTDPDPS